MNSYSEKLRKERREELALRALTFAAVTKSEGSNGDFPASDYAYVPDSNMSSTWKLRLTSTPGGDPDSGIVGAAVAALGAGFRGNKVDIPAADLPSVKAKVKAAWVKANPDKGEEDMPSVIACGDMMPHGEEEGLGYGPVEGADKAFLEALLPHHSEIMDLISKTDFEDDAVASYAADLAEKLIKGAAEIRSKLKVTGPDAPEGAPEVEMKKYTYDLELDETEFAGLPPFLKAGIIKGLEKDLAAEKDPDKKAEIQAKIDKLKPSKVEMKKYTYGIEMDVTEFGTLPPFLKAGIIKGLEKKMAAEKDPKMKAALQAKIDKLKG